MKYKLEIKPAIIPKERHKIEDVLNEMDYEVHGGGTDTDMSACDISFSKEIEEVPFVLGDAPQDSSAGKVEDD